MTPHAFDKIFLRFGYFNPVENNRTLRNTMAANSPNSSARGDLGTELVPTPPGSVDGNILDHSRTTQVPETENPMAAGQILSSASNAVSSSRYNESGNVTGIASVNSATSRILLQPKLWDAFCLWKPHRVSHK
jgi:hypothetical protein